MNPQYDDLGVKHNQYKQKYVFNEKYFDEYDAFAKYYRNVWSNGYILSISEEIENMGDYCDLYNNVANNTKSMQLNLFYEPFSDHQKNKNIIYATDYVKLQTDSEKGRHLIAAKNISRNSVIINEIPTVLQVTPLCSCIGNSRTSLYRCHHCGISCKQFYICDNCNVCIFCSRNCLTIAYKEYHVYECFGLQRHFWSMDDTDYSYISLRMMLYGALKNFNADCTDSSYGNFDNNYPSIFVMETHFKDMSVSKINTLLRSAVRNLLYLENKTSFFTLFKSKSNNIEDIYFRVGGLLVKHYCQAQINNVILKFPNINVASGLNISSGSGKAICPTIALINHACSPNATIIICSNYLVVKSIKSIRKGEEITVCYSEVNALFSLSERRMITEEILHFTCRCGFCLFEENSLEALYKCPFCEGGAKPVENFNARNLGTCTSCLKVFSIDNIMKELKLATQYKSAYSTSYSIESLSKLIESYKNIFPPNSFYLLDIYRLMYEKLLRCADKPMELLKYGLLIFHILETGLSSLYIPLLSAKIMFMAKIVDMKNFAEIKNATQEEFEIAKQFTTEVMKAKKDLLFYLPEENLHYYKYIQTKVHNFFKAIK